MVVAKQETIPQEVVVQSGETVVHNTGTVDKPQVFMKSNIKLVVWTNHNADKTASFENYNIRRVYKDKEEQWKETDGFSLKDLRIINELIVSFLNYKSPLKAL